MKTSESQKRANQVWNARNREHRRYLSSRCEARSFIRNRATEEDLQELEKLIAERRASDNRE